MAHRLGTLIAALLAALLVALPVLGAGGPISPTSDAPRVPADGPRASHRLIVELESPPLVAWSRQAYGAAAAARLDLGSAAAQSYLSRLATEHDAFLGAMRAALPGARIATYVNEFGKPAEARYALALNGVAVEPGEVSRDAARRALSRLPGVRAVHLDLAHEPSLYTSVPLIDAPDLWAMPDVGGRENAGAGVLVASMDGGVHRDAPMFAGDTYSYPPGFPDGGLGLTANNNGKIVVSRVYFRPHDPPAEGDETPWPGALGTSHGVHTASIAAGDVVTATYQGLTFQEFSGVAPKAWVGSYRVFYESVSGDGAFYTAEGLAALEDIVRDAAALETAPGNPPPVVLNASWGVGPGSLGGEFDPLDSALLNAAEAGLVVVTSAGNGGPGIGTVDHPSAGYIAVAATTAGALISAGQLRVAAPVPVPPALTDIPFAAAEFGPPLTVGLSLIHPLASAAAIDPANAEGCLAWDGEPFAGRAVLVARGTCDFSQKVHLAQLAGAEWVVVHNHEAGGDALVTMTAGAHADEVAIPSVFVGHSDGLALRAWHATHGDEATVELNTVPRQEAVQPDIVAPFSSRGPGVGDRLKPDIAAPGVSILAQGYAPGVSGVERHLGYGQASGTSMSAPHVAGAAALVRQAHPDWPPAYVKSALMSTAALTDVRNADGSPAGPLDVGAGRVDLSRATDPGVILEPPGLSFGPMVEGTVGTLTVTLTGVAPVAETYAVSAVLPGGAGPVPGLSVEPETVTLAPGATAVIIATFDSTAGAAIGEHQGYVLLDGVTYDAHLPAWARVVPAEAAAEVLIIDNDASTSLGFADYAPYYTRVVEALGYTYTLWDADARAGQPATIPGAAELAPYTAVIYYTGDNYYPDGSFDVSTPLTTHDMAALVDYVNGGGILIAMGQDLSSVLRSDAPSGGEFLYSYVLGGSFLRDSVSDGALPSLPVVGLASAPPAFVEMVVDLSGHDAYVGSASLSAEEVVRRVVHLVLVANGAPLPGAEGSSPGGGGSPVPEVGGLASFGYDVGSGRLDYSVELSATAPVSLSGVAIHRGAPGENGPQVHEISGPTHLERSLTLEGAVLLSAEDAEALLSGDLYLAARAPAAAHGGARGQIRVSPEGDGAANQFFVDEIEATPARDGEATYTPLLRYPGWRNLAEGIVAMAHRDQPSLERPGISYLGRSIYTTFGLEGVNDTLGFTTREQLLSAFLAWAVDEPAVTITDVTPADNPSALTVLRATLTSNVPGTRGVSYHWDLGDGSALVGPAPGAEVGHRYTACGPVTVRVEVTDSWGNVAIGSLDLTVTECAP